MINFVLGTILFDSPVGTLGPTLTREEFLNSDIGKLSSVSIVNPPHYTYTLPHFRMYNREFASDVYFKGVAIQLVNLKCIGNEFGNSWADWSLDKEIKRKELHDRLLIEHMGKRAARFHWGEVLSLVDLKTGGSYIIIKYNEK